MICCVTNARRNFPSTTQRNQMPANMSSDHDQDLESEGMAVGEENCDPEADNDFIIRWIRENSVFGSHTEVNGSLTSADSVGVEDESWMGDEVELRQSGGRRRTMQGRSVQRQQATLDRDSGLVNDSKFVSTCSTVIPSISWDDDSLDSGCHMIPISDFSRDANTGRKTLTFRRKDSRKDSSRISAIPLLGKSRTVWYVPPLYSDKSEEILLLIDEVRNSPIFSNLTDSNKCMLEAKFEIITSETKYLKSLIVLEDHFMYSVDLNNETILSRTDRQCLFAEVPSMRRCSTGFLAGLYSCLTDDQLLRGLFPFIMDYAKKHFHVFIKYGSNLKYIQETHKRLLYENVKYTEALHRLERNSICNRLQFNSFITEPLGRILKLGLPVKEVLKKLNELDEEFVPCRDASELLRNIGKACDDGAARLDSLRDMLKIANMLDFPDGLPVFPIPCSARRLLQQGSLTHHCSVRQTTLIYIFLFNDLLLLTRKQSDESYEVQDYCYRDLAFFTRTNGLVHLDPAFTEDCEGKYLMLLTLTRTWRNVSYEMVLSTTTDEKRQEWLMASAKENVNVEALNSWSRETASTVVPFTAVEPGQLSLSLEDEVQVVKRLSNGWYEGIRLKDGSQGRFPGSHTTLVTADHAQTCSLKRLYYLMNEEQGEE